MIFPMDFRFVSFVLRRGDLAKEGNRVEDEEGRKPFPEVGPCGRALVHQIEKVVIPGDEIPHSSGNGKVDEGSSLESLG